VGTHRKHLFFILLHCGKMWPGHKIVFLSVKLCLKTVLNVAPMRLVPSLLMKRYVGLNALSVVILSDKRC
jgi:hypothetical protein